MNRSRWAVALLTAFTMFLPVAAGANEWHGMRLANANIMGRPRMSEAQVRDDLNEIYATFKPNVLNGQEIARLYYKETWKLVAKRNGLATYGGSTSNPISISPAAYKVEKTVITPLSPAKFPITPAHELVTVLAHRPDGLKVAFQNAHYVPGAYSDHKVTWLKWRRQTWDNSWAVQSAEVSKLLAQGYTVIGSGDFNRYDLPVFHPRQVQLWDHGYDHIWAIPAQNIQVHYHDRMIIRTAGLYTDHAALLAELTLTRRSL